MNAAKQNNGRAEIATQVLAGLVLATLFLALQPLCTRAAQLEVIVKDRASRGVSEAVVAVSHPLANTAPPSTQPPLVVDQRHLRFVPEVLVVPIGSSVLFPNSDSISHQVYSFSSAKRFQLALYKGSPHPPVQFDQPGLVVMGCNIHDQMVGYVYVTDARWFGKTDTNGRLAIADVPPGEVTVTVWSPRIADSRSTLTRTVRIADAAPSVEFRLIKNLRASPEPKPRNPNWDY